MSLSAFYGIFLILFWIFILKRFIWTRYRFKSRFTSFLKGFSTDSSAMAIFIFKFYFMSTLLLFLLKCKSRKVHFKRDKITQQIQENLKMHLEEPWLHILRGGTLCALKSIMTIYKHHEEIEEAHLYNNAEITL